nr:MAG TPA: hypothetical protein [Bacteriophage sp.]
MHNTNNLNQTKEQESRHPPGGLQENCKTAPLSPLNTLKNKKALLYI